MRACSMLDRSVRFYPGRLEISRCCPPLRCGFSKVGIHALQECVTAGAVDVGAELRDQLHGMFARFHLKVESARGARDVDVTECPTELSR